MMDLYIVSVSFFNAYSISTEINELQDVRFFAKQLNMKIKSIENVLTSRRIPFTIRKGMLLFAQKEDALRAISCLKPVVLKQTINI